MGGKGPKGDLARFLLNSALGTSLKHTPSWDFPGSLMVEAPHFFCRGSRFDPWPEK